MEVLKLLPTVTSAKGVKSYIHGVKHSPQVFLRHAQMRLLWRATVRILSPALLFSIAIRVVLEAVRRQTGYGAAPVTQGRREDLRGAGVAISVGMRGTVLPNQLIESRAAGYCDRASFTEQCLNLGFVIAPRNKAEMHEGDSSLAIDQES